jgi:ribosomal protein S18 acetylase RimI-like enzyme
MIRDSLNTKLLCLALCHIDAFPNSLSSKMGLKYLEKMLSWYLESPNGLLFHNEENHIVKGYCGGIIVDGTLVVGSASSMTQHSFWAGAQALTLRPWLLFHPELLRKYKFVFRNLGYRFISPKKDLKISKRQEHDPYTGLVVIGVDPKFQGQGIGQILLKEFEGRTRKMGFKRMKLTVKADNEQAIGAYEKSGWEIYSNDGKSVGMQKILK